MTTHESVNIYNDIGAKLYLSIDNGSFTAKHWHYSLEVILILKGNFDIFINEKKLSLKEDDLMIINPKQIHSCICANSNESIVLQIPYNFLEKNIPKINNVIIDYKNLINNIDDIHICNLKNCLKELYNNYNNNSELYILKSKILLYKFLYKLYENYSIPIVSASYQDIDKSLDRLKIITDYIKENYKEKISLSMISKVVNLSPEYLSRFFKKYMGMTITSYVNNIRLENMFYDLINTNNNILDIIEDNGFYNYKQFIKLFKKTYNCTPSEKRKQINANKQDSI